MRRVTQLFAEGLSQKRHGARENLERLINELRYVKQINTEKQTLFKSTSFSSFIKISHSYFCFSSGWELKVNLENELNSSNPLYLFFTVMLSQISLRSWCQGTVTYKLPTMPFVVVACTALFRQPFHKQLYATKLWKLHTQKECTLKPRASVTRISAGTLSPNFTNITSPTTSFSAVMLCFSPSLRTVASCVWNILFPWTLHLRKGLLHHVLKGSQS